jgi:choline dehydrogenase-like flavoprotein
MNSQLDADLIIVGSGIGGATLAAAMAPTGLKIIVLEKGERLVSGPEARDDVAIFMRGHFAPKEQWMGSDGTPFIAGNHYAVGGNSKFFGAVMYRFREQDFRPRAHIGGTTAGWPFSYNELEPWYSRAEALFHVRGAREQDPTEPRHSVPYAYPPVPDEPSMLEVRRRLTAAGVHPAALPLAIDIEAWLAGGQTGWDAFPNTGVGKIDAETGPLTEALRYPNVKLITGAEVVRLESSQDGNRVEAAIIRGAAGQSRLSARGFAVAAGAIQTSALLLRSASPVHRSGLANGSDQVGRNFMNHNSSALIAICPLLRNRSIYQKTLSFNDFYNADPITGYPLGNVQSLGRLTAAILKGNVPTMPIGVARLVADFAFGWYLQSEDLANPDSRVTVRDDGIVMHWERTNMEAHRLLIERTRSVMRRAGFPLVVVRTFDRRTTSHQCGTARLGDNPLTSVVNARCKAHELDNLWITDASVLPTSAAVNPALTVAALALRAAGGLAAALAS